MTTRLIVTVTWNGDYYLPSERTDMATGWIRDAFYDRDDSPAVTIEPADVAAKAAGPEPGRVCRDCGATTGLAMLPYGPLDPVEWACADAQCTAGGDR